MLLRVEADGTADSLASFDGRVWTLQVMSSEEGMVSVMTGSPWYHPRLLSAISSEGAWTSDGTRWEAVLRDGETGEVRRVVPPVGGLFVDQSGRLWMGRQQVPPRPALITARASRIPIRNHGAPPPEGRDNLGRAKAQEYAPQRRNPGGQVYRAGCASVRNA